METLVDGHNYHVQKTCKLSARIAGIETKKAVLSIPIAGVGR